MSPLSDSSPISLKKNILWNTIGNLVYLFSQWLLSYFVVRFLGFEGAGIFSLATTITGVVIGISLYGMRSFQVSDIEEKYSDRAYKASRSITSLIALFVCALVVFFSNYSFYLCICILVYMCFKISESVSDVYQGILQRSMRMDYIGISFIIKGIITLVPFVLVVYITGDLFSSILFLFLTSTAIVLLYDVHKAKQFTQTKNQTVSLVTIKALLWECLPIAIYVLIFNAIALIPRYFLEFQMGTEALGIYGTIAMPVVVVQVSASFIFSPLITPFARHLKEGNINAFKSLLGRVLLGIGILSFVSLLGFGLFGAWFLQILFGAMIEPYTYLLIPLAICAILVALSWFLSSILVVLRKLKVLLWASGAACAAVIAISPFLLTAFSYNGASFSLIISLMLYVLLCSGAIFRTMKTTIRNN